MKKKTLRAVCASIAICMVSSGCGSDEEFSNELDDLFAEETTVTEKTTDDNGGNVTVKASAPAAEANELTLRKLKGLLLKYEGDMDKLCFKSSSDKMFIMSECFDDTSDIMHTDGKTVIYTYGDKTEAQPRYSDGAFSYSCDEKFIQKIRNTMKNGTSSFSYNGYSQTVMEHGGNYFDASGMTITVKDYDTLAVTAESIEYSVHTYETYSAYAYVKAEGEHYDIIIDPVSMSALNIPTLTYSANELGFNVNGTEFYADTIRLSGEAAVTFDSIPSDKYVYAKVMFGYLQEVYNTESGLSCAADVYGIDYVCEVDTLLTPDGSAVLFSETENAEFSALLNDKQTLFGENTEFTRFIDLDFDEDDELLVREYAERPGYAEDTVSEIKVYDLTGGKAVYIGSFDAKHYQLPFDNIQLSESVYIPEQKHGWCYKDGEDIVFMTCGENGIETKYITRVEIIDGEYKYYRLGEEIVPETRTVTDRYTGAEHNIYVWDGYAGIEQTTDSYEPALYFYSVMSEKAEKLFDILNTYAIYDSTSGKGYITDMSDDEYRKFASDLIADAKLRREAEKERKEGLSAHRNAGDVEAMKPMIYLYPEEKTTVSVKVENARLDCTYPEYKNGWEVTALPDGTLYDNDGNEYYCLYWEGEIPAPDMSEGFCVKGSDTAGFLREKLTLLGLSAKEANEFIIYWLPQMQNNSYNVISFHTDGYNAAVPLGISPAPQTLIRVFMTYYPSDSYADIPAQQFPQTPERTGFTVVEWGGTQLK